MFEELIKLRPCKNKKYLAWIREKGCLVCGQKAVAHHCEDVMGSRGLSIKHDLLAVPLCHEHHMEFHTYNIRFWERHNIDIKQTIIGYLVGYFS